jgi:hypothetical protein
MSRRRRPRRDIAFSFDAFLDVVANVVGIILRLILVAWMGARTYKAIVPPLPALPAVEMTETLVLSEPTDPRLDQLARTRREIGTQRDRVQQEEVREREAKAIAQQLREDLKVLAARRHLLTSQRDEIVQTSHKETKTSVSLQELRERSKKLANEAEAIKALRVRGKELRYRTPVSAPVTEEVMFECKHGRVTLIDTGAMLAEVKRETRARGEELRTKWSVTELTAPVGAFRLRYVFERERGTMDATPSEGSFRYALATWEVVPITHERGETSEHALRKGSAFRQVVDVLDASETAVTFWVYPDSFALYRELRDYLHDREVVVAGRPLPDGIPIASSRQGTMSQGQ